MGLQEGMTVRVHYTGTLGDGTRFDSSEGRDPLEFTIGAGQVIGGFEQAVMKLEPGQSTTANIDPGEAYGERYDEAVQGVPVSAFYEEPEVGMVVQLVAPDGRELAASVIEIDGETALLDFNHPLAGETLTFEIKLIEVIGAD